LKKKARAEQIPKRGEGINGWLYLGGRGTGKTRSAAEEMVWEGIRTPKGRYAILAPTFGDGRDICVEGESGLLRVINEYGVLGQYNTSKGQITLTNGARFKIFSGEEPKRLRGPQHHGAWIDELAAFDYAQDAFDMLEFGLRLGEHPFTIATTTPKPIPIIKDLIARNDWSFDTGSTFDNAANLPEEYITKLRNKYEGTRLGDQELYARILDDVEGALWTRQMIEQAKKLTKMPPLIRIVVGVDPALTNNENSDHTGIVVAGIDVLGDYYVLADRTIKDTPLAWATEVIKAFHEFKADRVVVETNAGGDLVELTLRSVDRNIPIEKRTASRGKQTRAEPISALYEQGKVHHIGLGLGKLEDQMCEWVPLDPKQSSPDRIDALVWAMSDLVGDSDTMQSLYAMSLMCPQCGFPNRKVATMCVKCNHKFEKESA
jgi:phage terminase large subunit-like protein